MADFLPMHDLIGKLSLWIKTTSQRLELHRNCLYLFNKKQLKKLEKIILPQKMGLNVDK